MRSFKIFLALSLFSAVLLSFTQSKTAKLTIEVDKIQDTSGKPISVGVFDRSTFPKIGKAQYVKFAIPKDNKLRVIFDLPQGEYAVAIFHDLNGNKTLDKNFFGIPKEPYGFSKNFKPVMTAPEFEDCSFKLTDSEKNISISLIH